MKIIQALLTVTICALIIAIAAADEHNRQFKRFIKMHRRSYPNSAEKQMRFAVFKKNLLQIAELNKRHNESDMFGITQFADWTAEECKQFLSSGHDIETDDNLAIKYEADPDELSANEGKGIDWRKKNGVTPVKNQGSCGADYAFSTIAAIESQYKMRRKVDFDISEQELIDCVKGSQGCENASMFSTLQYAKETGLLYETDYPYEAKQGKCKVFNHKAHITKLSWIRGFENLKNYLLKNGPFIGLVQLPPSILHYKSGLFKPTDCDNKSKFRTWLVVGLECHDSEPYWIIKNSWGESWGEKGFIRFAAATNLCGINKSGFGVEV